MSKPDIRKHWAEFREDHPRLDHVLQILSPWIPPLNFITLHYAFFIFSILFWSAIFWASSEPAHSVGYVDSLFLVTSAITNTGLNTINLSQLTAWQQVLLWLLFIVGSPIMVSFVTVLVRKHAFERRFEGIVKAEREMRKRKALLARSGFPLRSLLSFTQPKTEPTASDTTGGLSGLGSIVPRGTGHDGSQDLEARQGPPSLRRILTAPQTTEPLANGRAARSPQTLDSPQAGSPRQRITFAMPPTTNGAIAQAAQDGRPQSLAGSRIGSLNASLAESEADEDLLYHFKKILGRKNINQSGQFFDLSHHERELLGGCEYRALRLLSFVVPFYAFLWMFLGSMALGAWFAHHYNDPAKLDGADPWWAGIFVAVSGFNNAGMSLLDANMIPLNQAYFVLVVGIFLILAGNTAYPLFLRFILWSTLKILRLTTAETTFGPWKETLEFILKFPRRVYTTLFPSQASWWLFAVLILFNLIDWFAFEVLNIGNDAVDELSMGTRILGGLFQAVSVRAAGFVAIPIPILYPGTQFLYVIMMYISAYPVVITLRKSNIYEERSLGIYSDDPSLTEQPFPSQQAHVGDNLDTCHDTICHDSSIAEKARLRRRKTSAATIGNGLKRTMSFHGVGVRRPSGPNRDQNDRVSFVAQQIRGQLAHDLWWLTLAILIIVIVETSHFRKDPLTFSIFNIIFETVSAYGTVGLSTGLPNDAYSFSGGWHRASKVLLCLVMLRGRHRGLPVALDAAVRLPGEHLHQEEEEDFNIRKSNAVASRMSREFRRQP